MGQDNTHSVLLPLPPDVYNSLRDYGAGRGATVHYVSKELLMKAFQLWQEGKLEGGFAVKPDAIAMRRYRGGLKLRETLRKKKEERQG